MTTNVIGVCLESAKVPEPQRLTIKWSVLERVVEKVCAKSYEVERVIHVSLTFHQC